MKHQILILMALIFGMVSCNNPLSPGTKESSFGPSFRPGIKEPAPNKPRPSHTGFKLSPGSGQATGVENNVEMTIMPNDRLLRGTKVNGRFSIGKSSSQ